MLLPVTRSCDTDCATPQIEVSNRATTMSGANFQQRPNREPICIMFSSPSKKRSSVLDHRFRWLVAGTRCNSALGRWRQLRLPWGVDYLDCWTTSAPGTTPERHAAQCYERRVTARLRGV